MAYSITDLENDLEAIIHGTTINKIINPFALFNRAARQILLDLDPQETKRVVQFTTPIFNSVWDYPLAADVKGISIIDIRPQVNRTSLDVYNQLYNQAFDVAKQNTGALKNDFTINFNTALKSIRVNAPFLSPPISLNTAESTTSNGTWTTGGTASNLTNNSQNYIDTLSSLKFNVATGTGYVENSTMSPVDLTNNLNQATQFLYAYVPTGSSLTSIELRFGSDSSNYYKISATTTQQNTTFQNGWNLVAFPWSSATTVGSPVITAIDYIRVSYVVSASLTGVGLNGITSSLGTYLEYEYYSKYLFRDSVTGAFQETVSNVTNLINLDTETYNIMTDLVALLAAQQTQGGSMVADVNFFQKKYDEAISKYKGRYKSELQKPQSIYYKKPNKSYGGGWWINGTPSM